MLNISKYHKLVLGCSAIATATLGGVTQSANATEQFTSQSVRRDSSTMLLASANTNGGGTSPSANTNPGGTGPNANTNPGTAPTDAGGTGPNANTNPGGLFTNTNPGGFSPGQIAFAQGLSSKIDSLTAKQGDAASKMAALEAAETNASSRTSPVRYGREPGDIASCGCPNADTVGSGTATPSAELVAARAAESEAAAELAAAKAEARQFLESVKNSGGSGRSGNFSPIW
ncbi:MAG: hypothetical protein LH474_07195 [Chamaesiphon sp.]|nr:hypothetical protein [Chamaesiphon sp.]